MRLAVFLVQLALVPSLLCACRARDARDRFYEFNRNRRGLCMASDSICGKYPYCPGGETKRDCLDRDWKISCTGAPADGGAHCGWLSRDSQSFGFVDYAEGCVLALEGQRPCVCGPSSAWVCSDEQSVWRCE